MTIKEMGSKRLFVGNLFPDVSQDDLQQRFSKFGSVTKIEIKNKKDIDGQISQTFAFIDIGVTDNGLSQCISTLANKKWKGYLMTVQQARESFMERLARERKEREAPEAGSVTKEEAPKAVKRSYDEDEFKIVNNKVPKRDYTEEREAFQGFGKKTDTREKYDPLKLFKSKLAGEENPEPVEEIPNTENMGKIENGIVMFENDEAGKETLLAVNKKYHSSSEDEEEVKRKAEKKLKKKKAKEDIKSVEFKEKMTKRFLEKQKANQELTSSSEVKSTKKEKSKNKSKFYEDTSDEEEEVSGKTGTDVLKTFQSFSNFWQDSDNEEDAQPEEIPDKKIVQDEEIDNEEDSKPAEIPVKKIVQEEEIDKSDSGSSDDSSDSDSDESDEDDDDDDDDDEEEVENEVPVKEPVQLVSDVSMPRYDPTREDHEKFHRSTDANKEDHAEEEFKPSKFFEVKTDLKKVFGTKSEKSSGFSFGFSKEEGQVEENESKSEFSFGFGAADNQEAAMDVDSDGEEIIPTKKKDDVASKFGLMLKGKGVPKSDNTFFFSEEDPRLEEGLAHFFDTEIDLDKLRQDYNEKRPILSDILRKRTRNKAKRKESSKNAFGKKKFNHSWRKGGKRKELNR